MTNAARLITAANRWRDGYNPLRALTMPRAVALMEEAQRGVMADLQWLYASELGIEATDCDLMTIIEKTLAGVADMDWQIVTADHEQRGFDAALAQEQKDFLESAYNACDNLPEAIEHLVMARFRGFSHLQPWLKPDWTIEHLEPLPQWNMVRDGTSSRWAWNPEAHQKPYRAFGADALLSPDDYIILENRRPVNRIALVKYIRSTIAEKDWDAYVEIYGIPGVFIIMPPNIPQGQEGKYRDEAVAASEAASGALPNGSDVKTLSEVRGVQPFQTRLEWLQKQLILAGTGGMLTSLAEPTGIGGGASGVQENAWTTIVRRVAHKVESAIVRQYDRRALAAMFPGRPALASFALRTKQEKDVGAAVDSISKLATAGYQVDPEQVEAETGYKVTLKPVADPSQGQFAALNSAVPRRTPLQTNEKPLQNAPSDSDGQGDPSGQPPAQIAKNRPSGAEAVLAEIAATILDGSSPYEEALETARKKLEKIDPELLAGDLEKELESAMFQAAAEVATGGEARNSECHAKNPAHCPTHGTPREPETKSQHDRYGLSDVERLAAEPAKNAERATSALEEVMRKRGGFVDKAAYRPECGWIRLDWGDAGDPGNDYKGGHGLAHIAAKHPDDLKHLPDVIAKGEAFRHPTDNTKTYFVHGERFAVVASLKKGAKKTITEYAPDRPKDLEVIKNYPRAQAPGKKGG